MSQYRLASGDSKATVQISGVQSALPVIAQETTRSYRRTWRLVVQYGLSAVLAWGATALSFSHPAFRDTRLALSFVVITLAALLAGVGPALVAMLVSGLTATQYPRAWANTPLWSLERLLPTIAVLLPVALVLFLTYRRRQTEYRLRSFVRTLQEQTEALMRAQQATRSAAWVFRPQTQRTRWYPGGAEVFGLPQAEVDLLRSPFELIIEEDRAAVEHHFATALRSGDPFRAEFRVRWPNGDIHWLEARASRLMSKTQEWRGATMDITERKRAEQALIQTEKLAIAGRLAASIAHEINNPLEAVINLCYLARATSTSPESSRYIQTAEEELSRVAQITSQTLRFHRQQSAPVNTNLVELTTSVLKLYEARLRERRVTSRLESREVQLLRCYAGEIRQVLANLVGNAIDAMPEGGALRLRVRPGTAWATGAPAIRITVADTGHGMSPATLLRIWEPFYTTKDELGTGLGLWVSVTLVEKHHGRIYVRSSALPRKEGTIFSIVLPYGTDVAFPYMQQSGV